MKYLSGSDLASFIKERQLHQVRILAGNKIFPKLAIVICGNDLPSQKYIGLKQEYGNEIGIAVEIYKVEQTDAIKTIGVLNSNKEVQGIIVQLPLPDIKNTDEILNSVLPSKDLDGLGQNSIYDSATPTAIMWLLAGYNVNLAGKQIVIVGQGRLIGKPLVAIMQSSGLNPVVVDEFTENIPQTISEADVLVTAVGKANIIKAQDIRQGAVVIDAGVASENGVLKGDLADDVYERDDLTLTPKTGGVGPLTVCALFDNVIKAAQPQAK